MAPEAPPITIDLDGSAVEIPSEGTLLDALRDTLGITSLKDGCSPQGQCGCCTVLVDGVARVACVTPARRVAGRSITTLEGLDPSIVESLVVAFEGTGASQCGFCTPGILARLVGLARRGVPTEASVRTALGAHLCRCTGFQPIVEAACRALDPDATLPAPRDPEMASRRATLESGTTQLAGRDVVLGAARFAADTAPERCAVAIAVPGGGYVLGATPTEARALSAKIQGRNSTVPLLHPVAIAEIDDAVVRLATTFVEPGYVEPDASWCEPGGIPAIPFANAGAFGAKRNSAVSADARRLADERGEAVLVLWPREEVVRRGKKRPPVSIALRADGSGSLRVGVTPDSDSVEAHLEMVRALFPALEIELIDIAGPPVGITHRGAVLGEVLAATAVLGRSAGDPITVESPNGACATVSCGDDGTVSVSVAAGDPLCEVTLASYVTGAVHQGLGMVLSEGIAVDEGGAVQDLTIRSFGILPASKTPRIDVAIELDDREALACGTAVMAATMAATWLAHGLAPEWPLAREARS